MSGGRAATTMGERGSVARGLRAPNTTIGGAHGEHCLIVEFGLPTGAMEQVMVETAQQHEPVQIGATAGHPVVDVVDIAPARRTGAARRPTVMVPGDHGSAQRRGNAANCSAELEHMATIGDDPLENGIAGESVECERAEGGTVGSGADAGPFESIGEPGLFGRRKTLALGEGCERRGRVNPGASERGGQKFRKIDDERDMWLVACDVRARPVMGEAEPGQ